MIISTHLSLTGLLTLFFASLATCIAVRDTCPGAAGMVSFLVRLHNATPFCSRYLALPTSTVVSIISETVSAITIRTVTTTTAYITLPAVVATKTQTNFVTTVVPAASLGIRDIHNFRIEERAVNVPAYLAVFPANAISRGCSCHSISPSKTTTYTTATHFDVSTIQQTLTQRSTVSAFSTITTTVTAAVTSVDFS